MLIHRAGGKHTSFPQINYQNVIKIETTSTFVTNMMSKSEKGHKQSSRNEEIMRTRGIKIDQMPRFINLSCLLTAFWICVLVAWDWRVVNLQFFILSLKQ